MIWTELEVYVQDLIEEQGRHVCRLLDPGFNFTPAKTLYRPVSKGCTDLMHANTYVRNRYDLMLQLPVQNSLSCRTRGR